MGAVDSKHALQVMIVKKNSSETGRRTSRARSWLSNSHVSSLGVNGGGLGVRPRIPLRRKTKKHKTAAETDKQKSSNSCLDEKKIFTAKSYGEFLLEEDIVLRHSPTYGIITCYCIYMIALAFLLSSMCCDTDQAKAHQYFNAVK